MKMIYLMLFTMALLLMPLIRSGFIELVDDPYGSPEEHNSTTTEYGATWDRSCDGGTCNMLLYSGVRNADENGTRIENAKSLKDCQFCNDLNLNIDLDKRFNIIVGDYNYTNYKDVCFSSKEIGIIPLKIYRYNESENETTGNIIRKKINEVNIAIPNLIANQRRCFNFTLKKSIFDYVIKWGYNSTELILQDADTENLDDTYINEQAGTATYGADVTMRNRYWDGNQYELLLKFDITQIPFGNTIDSSDLYLKVESNDLDASEGWDLSAHHVYSFPNFTHSDGGEWNEGNSDLDCTDGNEMCWNERPVDPEFNTTAESINTMDDSVADESWVIWDILTMTSTEYDEGDNNISIWLVISNVEGTPGASEEVDFRSKEDGTSANRPYLNVTYTEAAPPPAVVNCTFPNDYGEPKTINMSWHCNITTESWAKELNFTDDAGWMNVSSILNVTNITNFLAGQIIYAAKGSIIYIKS